MDIKPYKLIKYVYGISVLLISALPTEKFFHIPLKVFATLFLVISYIFVLCKYNIKISKQVISFISLAISIILLYTFWGSIHFGYISLLETKLIIVTFVLVFIMYIFHTKVFSKEFFLRIYTYNIFLVCLIKLLAYIYGYLYGGREASVLFYHQFFNAQVVSMDLPFGMFRLYLISDIIGAFYPLVLCWAIREKIPLSSFKVIFILIISLFLVISSFSRYLITVYCIGFLIFIFINRKYLKVSIIILTLLLISYPFHSIIIKFIKLRLHCSRLPDLIRSKQTLVLINLFLQSPYVGLGLGAYDPNYIRSAICPFSYEKQILSFLPKIGLIGILLIFSGVIFIIYKFLRKFNLIGLISIFLFMLSGWFNPYLYSSNVVLIYTFILITNNNFNSLETITTDYNFLERN